MCEMSVYVGIVGFRFSCLCCDVGNEFIFITQDEPDRWKDGRDGGWEAQESSTCIQSALCVPQDAEDVVLGSIPSTANRLASFLIKPEWSLWSSFESGGLLKQRESGCLEENQLQLMGIRTAAATFLHIDY